MENKVYVELFEEDIERVKRIAKLTGTVYNKEINSGLIGTEQLLSMMFDLVYEIDHLEEKYNDLEENLKTNYVHRPMSDYTGYSYDDRY